MSAMEIMPRRRSATDPRLPGGETNRRPEIRFEPGDTPSDPPAHATSVEGIGRGVSASRKPKTPLVKRNMPGTGRERWAPPQGREFKGTTLPVGSEDLGLLLLYSAAQLLRVSEKIGSLSEDLLEGGGQETDPVPRMRP